MGIADTAIESANQRPSYLDSILDDALNETPPVSGSTGVPDPTRQPAFPTTGQNIQYDPQSNARDAVLAKFGAGITKAGQGVKQFSLQVAEAIPALEGMGIIDPGTTAVYTKLAKEEREYFDLAFKSEFGDSWVYDLAEVAGEIAPFMAVPGANIESLAGKIVAQGAAGAAGGAIAFAEDPSQRMENIASGGAFGAATSPILTMLGKMRRFVSGALGRPLAGKVEGRAGAEATRIVDRFGNVETSTASQQLAGLEASAINRSRKLADEGFQVFDEASDILGEQIPVKVKNLTDDPFLRNMEELAGQSTKGSRVIQEIELQQVDKTLKFWNKVIESTSEKARTTAFYSDVTRAFDQVMEGKNGLLTVRAKQAEADFGLVDKLSGRAKNIPMRSLVASLDKQIADLTMEAGRENLLGARAKATLKELRQLRESLRGGSGVIGLDGKPVNIEDGMVNANELQKLLNRFGKASQGSGRLFTDAVDKGQDLSSSKSLFKAAMADLDDAADNLVGTGSVALKVARDRYRIITDRIRSVQQSALGKLFNTKGELTREAIETAFLKMNASEIRHSMDVLEKADPLMKFKLQHLYLMEMVGKASTEGPFSKIPFSPGRMFDLLRNDAKFRAVFSTTEELKLVKLGLDLTKRVVDNVGASTPSGALPRLKNIAGVAMSMDTTFMARLFAELLVPNRLLTSVLTEKGIRNLQKAATQPNTSIGIPAAIGATTADE